MNTSTGRGGLAVIAAIALMAGCAPVETSDGPGRAGDEPVGETQEAFSIECSNAGGTQAGTLVVNFTPRGTFCFRTGAIGSGGAPPPAPQPGTPACWELAKRFGCMGF